MNLSAVISQLAALFLMILAGYISARADLISPQFRQKLSSLALNTAAPCIILSSVLESESGSADMAAAVGVGVFFFALMIALAALLVRVCRVPRAQRGLDQLMLVFTNVGFMGIPVVQSIYGPTGVALLSMFILIFNLCFFSYGVLLISGGLSLNPRALLNTCIVAALLALLFGLTGWHLPAPVETALSAIGAMNTPLAMMIIGASIAHSDLRAAFSSPRLYLVSLLRMAVMPLCILGIVAVLPIPRMLAGICVALAAMPVAGNCAMISDLYTPEDMTASQAVMLTTLLSAVTLPLICAAMLAVLA
ncbi:MAG: AEC family transporter [Clostridiales bacterium]|nr:AEC family transporter [Clostridiales bacterium]MDY5350115.1 AEC family transporter [Candidatus Ventricola sp.]MDY5514319.1 AEC family transporter [Candidatus Ventricola sp.]